MDQPEATPFVPEAIRIAGARVELAALDYGRGNEAAPPMLLIHGMRDLAWSMDSIAQHFRDRYRVISLDLRGHGDSDAPGAYAIQHFVVDLHLAVRRLRLERPTIVAHSFGGEVATQFAGLFPEIPSACVLIEGLGPPPWEGEANAAARRQMARSSIEALDEIQPDGRRVADLDDATARVLRNHARLDPQRARYLASKGTRPHPEGGLRWKWDPYLRTSFGSFSREQAEERWGWIECPVLVVMGGESGAWWNRARWADSKSQPAKRPYLSDAELERRLALFADAELEVVPAAGHMIHFDAPAALNDAIDRFLERRASA